METLRRAAKHGPVVVLNYGYALAINNPSSSQNTHRLTGKQEGEDNRTNDKVWCVVKLDIRAKLIFLNNLVRSPTWLYGWLYFVELYRV
jgi:hypothetical protein